MSFQRIINGATSLNVDKRKTTAMSVSRSGHVKTAERQPSVYKFVVAPTPILKYSTNRDLLEDIDTLDRVTEANVSLADNSNMAYITNYQGSLSPAQQAQVDCLGSNGKTLYLKCDGVTGNTSGYTHLVKKGDFIQPVGDTGTYRYPYQVTADVTDFSGANVAVSVHRPVLSQTGTVITGSDPLRFGGDCRFHVKATKCPTYTVVPHDFVQFTGDFEFVEIIT